MDHTFRSLSFVVFWIGAGLAVSIALIPQGTVSTFPGDKVQHVVCFLVLTLAGLLWVTKKVPFLVALALAGVALELIQALPFIERQAAFLDGFANVVGMAMGLTLYRSVGRVVAAASG